MHPFDKPIGNITLADIEALIQDQVPESRTLDYKRDLYTNSDRDKKNFLIDVSAFANTVGGYLIIGIAEEDSVPKTIDGVKIQEFDNLKLRFENILRMSVDPSIRGVEFHAVDFADDKKVLIIEVPRSISRPHAVTFQKYHRFHGRNSCGTYPFEVDDIRQAILESETLATKIKNFRNNRVSMIVVGETPIPLKLEAKVVLHIMPVSSFELNAHINFDKVEINEMPPITSGSYGKRYNLDGLFISNEFSYVQLFKNGIIEAVDTFLLEPNILQASERQLHKYIPSEAFEIDLVKSINKYFILLNGLCIKTPIWIGLSLLNVRGYWMNVNRRSPSNHQEIDRDDLLVSEILLDDIKKPGEVVLKPIFDCVWNACGIERSFKYDEDGNWLLKGR
jgi:hypothetical protein